MQKRQILNEPWELDFLETEYRSRVTKAQRLMQSRNIGALFLSHKDNLLYFTGFRTWIGKSQHRHFADILPAHAVRFD